METKDLSNSYESQLMALSQADKDRLLVLTKDINPNDFSSVHRFGHEVTDLISKNGDIILSNVTSKTDDEIINLVNDVLSELELVNIDELSKEDSKIKAFLKRFPIFKRLIRTTQDVINKSSTVLDNVEKISSKMQCAKLVALRDNSTLQNIYDNNVESLKQLKDFVLAAKLKQDELKHQIDEMSKNGAEEYEIQNISNLEHVLSKRIANMIIHGNILMQNLYEIRLLQSNNLNIMEQTDAIVNNYIPIWKGELSTAILIKNQKHHIDSINLIKEKINYTLEQNARNIRDNSISVAKASEGTFIDVEVIKKRANSIVDAASEVKKIYEEGKKQYVEIENTIAGFKKQLQSI